MKIDTNTQAKFAFAAFLLLALVASAFWYLVSVGNYLIYQISTEESVSGLIVDAPVEFHGVDVGKVKSVKLLNPHTVRILLSIDKTAPITSASVATLTSRGLASRGFTGYVYIAIEDAGMSSGPLTRRPGEAYPTIPTAPSKSMTLDTTLNQATANVQALTDLLQSTLDKKTVVALKQSAESLQQVTKVLAANSKRMNTIVANTESASRRLAPLLDSSHDSVTTLQTQILPQARSVLDSSHDTVRALQTQILPEAHKALTDLDDLSGSTTAVTNQINRNPSILIRGTAPPAPGPGERK
ncbi:MlaD family protein [Massilia terrae]|uniref:MlaD family protein n=1 Tax=Massilia terrae TaxID=1811224 RepID=A0ABT2CSA8_9BURK|nr:MlaD family protein [Massilia terrae]MCS0656857.1 MlaD family protein [Massilia terrae]